MAVKKQAGLLMTEGMLKKRYPSAGLASQICLPSESALWLPSQILSLDWHLGGGIPYGKIIEGFGQESTGKSLLAKSFAVACQALGGIVLWSDPEVSFDAIWAKKNGLDLDRVYLLPQTNEIETISDWQADMIVFARSKLIKNEPILLVTDSIAALETRDNLAAGDMDSGEDMGKRSKKIYQMLRKRNTLYAKYGVCVYYINQLRQKPTKTKYEDPDTTPGGKAMAFFADQRIGLYRGKKITDTGDEKGKTIGQFVHIRSKKNKVAPPREKIIARVLFKEHNGKIGYDKRYYLGDILVNEGVIRRKNGRFYYKKEQIAYGEKALETLLNTNDKLRQTFIKKLGINTISQTRAKIDALTKNLYPVNGKKAKKEDNSEGE